MKQAFWKRLLSYVDDVLIERVEGEHNEELYVLLSKGRYQLCTANAIYSFADKYDNFKLSFDQLDWEKYEIETVLVLGLGLASIPYMLEKMGKKFKYTAIEIDENVVHLANKYVLDELKSPIEVQIADAHSFLLENKRKFDLILMDVFVDDYIPQKFRSTRFMEALQKAMEPGGLILYNLLNQTEADKKDAEEFFEIFKTNFTGAHFMNVKGNKMLFYQKPK